MGMTVGLPEPTSTARDPIISSRLAVNSWVRVSNIWASALGNFSDMPEQTVWRQECARRPGVDSTLVVTCHLGFSKNRSETLCGKSTRGMSPVPTPWVESASRCPKCGMLGCV